MNVDVEFDDDLARALLALTRAEGLEEAVVIAVEHFVRRERLERFRALKGKVDFCQTTSWKQQSWNVLNVCGTTRLKMESKVR